ncbi:MAG: glycosyltransferase family 39 protein, partial [Candidatus Levybacteria bacterium]|nr:glycosyltransferase family 39 protein [Candidatus Levybacteria bacterium]
KSSFSITLPKDIVSRLSICLLLLLLMVNGIGVLGPETSFDALWYHLTLAKLSLATHTISFIPGGLLYYSVMPKLGELFFIPVLLFGNEIWAKAIQFLFGIFTTVAIYKISRRYVSVSLSLLAGLVFYGNIVVAWESTVAYIDLIRTFYEAMGLWALLLWIETKKRIWLYVSAMMIGFAISTKLLAVGSLGIVTLLILFILLREKKLSVRSIFSTIGIYWVICLVVVLPWLIFSYTNTGNPIYPFFTSLYPIHSSQNIFSLQNVFIDFGKLFLSSDDPISPMYVIVLPLIFVFFSKLKPQIKIVVYYALFASVIWYITPRTGGGRFILPYLPAFSILVIAIVEMIKRQKIIYITIVTSIFLVAAITVVYRGIANSRYLPVIIGTQTKAQFLTNNLNFSFGDFYDIDGYFAKHIKAKDTVLLYGFHNLYYVDFPFIDSSYVQNGDTFTHIATQNTTLPKRFTDWELIYENKTTSVRLYTKEKKIWHY